MLKIGPLSGIQIIIEIIELISDLTCRALVLVHTTAPRPGVNGGKYKLKY